MAALLPFLILLGALAAVLGLFTWLAARIRRRGLAGGALSAALASYEEAFRVTSHASHIELRAQADRKAPILLPDGPWADSPGQAGNADGPGRRRPEPRPRRSRRRLARWVNRLGRPGR
ncbi:hypothetical protein [Streptomyces lincolnensis]|uniref:hypothetical protein n=1 Tax=Streptomyces lincolnensis TaxID=1915 RepID=UPI0008307CB9|nr:hypothetical protein [Streptomyces lincolnensis]